MSHRGLVMSSLVRAVHVHLTARVCCEFDDLTCYSVLAPWCLVAAQWLWGPGGNM